MNDPTKPMTEPIRGRFVDAITYLTLIMGMISEAEGIYRKDPKEELKKKRLSAELGVALS